MSGTNYSSILQVPKNDLLNFTLALVQELHDPLVKALTMDGEGMMGTVLLCESLLSLLPTMSTKDMPYHLLRAYNITPIGSGVIAKERHLSLVGFASVFGDILHLSNPVVHRIFVPLNQLPADGRRQVVRMLKLLEEIQKGDGHSVAEKCAVILVKTFVEELLSTKLVSRRAVLLSPAALVKSGCGVHSVVSAREYVSRTFDVAVLPRSSRLRDFLKTALDLCGEDLVPALTDHLIQELSFVPRVVVHESTVNFSATTYYALSRCSLAGIRDKARHGTLAEDDCMPILKAVEVTLHMSFTLDWHLVKKISRYVFVDAEFVPGCYFSSTRYTPMKRLLISNLFRRFKFRTNKAAFAVFTLAHILWAKEQRILQRTLQTRPFQRAHNIHLTASIADIKQLVLSTLASHTISLIRPFSINIQRIV